MHVDGYEKLAEALDALPARFPRTPARTELALLRKLYTPEQAHVAAAMTRDFETVAAIAARAGMAEDTVLALLPAMLAGRMVLRRSGDHGEGDADLYRLQSFLPGALEGTGAAFDEETAELFRRYMADGGALGIMGADPAIARVTPNAAAADRTEWILPFDDVRAIIAQAGTIVLSDCFCRLERAREGEPCRFPLHVCLNLHATAPVDGEGVISREEALAVLAEAEEAGLVHCVSNVAGGWEWVCNCCGCCCEFLRGITEWDVDRAVVRNYRAVVDAEACSSCGICAERCQVSAIAIADEGGAAVVDAVRCIGCGLCVSGCPDEAVTLRRLPEPEITVPPADWDDWEDRRSRGD
jgi:Pyruvate/2-oxoacid:ferredoxin oxidoreductase delta subunit